MSHIEEDSGDYLGISGDFKWKSADGKKEVVLRLQPGGKWWHAVHLERPGTSLASHINWDESATWDMVESLGRWRLVNVPVSDDVMPNSVAARLTCESCRWASGEHGLKPTKSTIMSSVDNMVELGQVTMDYVVQWCPETCLRSLVLHIEESEATDWESSGDIFSAIRALGFESTYDQLDEAPAALTMQHHPSRSVGNVSGSSSTGQRPWGSGVAAMADGIRIAGLCAGLRCREEEESKFNEEADGAVPICEVFPRGHGEPTQHTANAETSAEDHSVDALGRRDSDKPVGKVFTEIEDDLPTGSLDGS